MQTYKGTPRSNMYAPDRTCPKCGWSGKDWGFKYHRYCTKCHNKWRKEKAEERRRWKPLNENIEIAEGIVVTRNVRQRLEEQAHSEVPRTRRMILSDGCEFFGLLMSLAAFFVFAFTVGFYPDYAPFLVGCMIVGFITAQICGRVHKEEERKRMPEVNTRLGELARERQRQIDETNSFYASPEWRLVRERTIQEQGRVCQHCHRRISKDYDVTVDHIKPRSKFPELALETSNLQVLCRKCNSAKGATYEEASVPAHSTSKV